MRVVFDAFMDACDAGGAWLVVPTLGDVRRAREEITRRRRVVMGARVGTFHHLVREVAGVGDGGVDPSVELLVVRRQLERTPALRSALAYPGFTRTAARILRELRSAAVAGSAELDVQLGTLPAADRGTWRRLSVRVEEALADVGLRDSAWYERAAIRAVELGEPVPPVFAWGFDDLSAAQQRVLVTLSRHTQATLTFPFEPGRNVFARRQRIVDALCAQGARAVVNGEAQFDSAELEQLERRFGEVTAHPVEGPLHDVSFVEVCGDLQECEEVVREVAGLLVRGVAAEEIGVLTAEGHPPPLLASAFSRAGIGATFEYPRTVRDTPVGRVVLDLLAAAIQDDPLGYLSWARSPFSGLERDDIDRWALALLPELPVTEGRGRGWWLDGVPEPVRRLVRGGGDALESTTGWLRTLVPQGMGDTRLLAAMEGLLESLGPAGGKRRPSLVEIHEALAALPIPVPDQRPAGAVVVAPVTRVRTDRFDAVILCGLHSGGFGGGHQSDEDHAAAAQELAYVAITRARRWLGLVRQVATSDGRLRGPHPVWRELRRLLPGAVVTRRRLDAVVPAPAEVRMSSEVLPSAALWVGEDPPSAAVLPAAVRSSVDALVVPAAESKVDWDKAARIPPNVLSVSDVETYLGCPSRWFIQRRLLPDDPAGMSSRQIVGTLVHDVLAELVPALGGEPVDRRRVESLVGVATRRLPRSARARTIDMQHAVAIVQRTLEQAQPPDSVALTEVGFGGPDDELPALAVEGALLRGRIDRIDVGADGSAVIVDYKLARSATAAAKLLEEGRLQALLYWAALDASGRYQPVASLYHPLEGERPRGLIGEGAPTVVGEFRTDRLATDDADELVAAAVREAANAAAGIQAGRFPAAPLGGACPTWCTLASICRVGGR